jgi:phosphoribosylglycinamide formyltransferase-1
MIKLAIFASGSGTNAEKIMEFFEDDHDISVGAVFCNKPNAGVIERAKKFGVHVEIFDKKDLEISHFCKRLDFHFIDFIVLAGFLLKIPSHMIKAFPERIVNIHPSLLPKYGGKGMYGDRVHEAVLANKDIESGITIHLVNDVYDDGRILCQKKCEVLMSDSTGSLAARIHELEHQYFPKIVNEYVRSVT